MRLRQITLAAAFAAFHFTAQASLINPLEYDDGVHSWLKLSETVGISIDQFRSGVGGWNSVYRLATNEEISTLLTRFGIAEGDTGYRRNMGSASNFIFSIGGTAPGSYYAGTWGSNGNQGAVGIGLGWLVSAELIEEGPGTAECPRYFTCARTVAMRGSYNSWSNVTGLFLVRDDHLHDVPEPGSLALMGLAGGLLAYRHRKKSG